MRVIAAEYPVPLLPTGDNPEGGFIQPAPAEPVEVPEHSYYLRRLATGELLRAPVVPATEADAKATASTKPAKATKAEPAATEDTPQ